MKNPFQTLLLFCYLIFLSIPLAAQNNQASIFELDRENIALTALHVHQFLDTNSVGPASVPTINELIQFFSLPFGNRIYQYEPDMVPVPGLRLFEQAGNLFLHFDNLANTSSNMILSGALDYLNPGGQSFISVQGEEVYNGFSFSTGTIQYRIYMIGTLSNNCSSGTINQCYGNFEIIIVDKNIL